MKHVSTVNVSEVTYSTLRTTPHCVPFEMNQSLRVKYRIFYFYVVSVSRSFMVHLVLLGIIPKSFDCFHLLVCFVLRQVKWVLLRSHPIQQKTSRIKITAVGWLKENLSSTIVGNCGQQLMSNCLSRLWRENTKYLLVLASQTERLFADVLPFKLNIFGLNKKCDDASLRSVNLWWYF